MTDTPSLVSSPAAARRRHALLGARTRRLARPRREGEAVASIDCLVCEAGGALYALPLLRVARVAPFRRPATTPSVNPGLLGVLGVAGKLYHVFDLGRLLSGVPSEAGGHVVVLRGTPAMALQVRHAARVARLVALSAADGAQIRPAHPAVSGFARPLQADLFEGQIISILDPDHLTSRVSDVRAEGDPRVDQ